MLQIELFEDRVMNGSYYSLAHEDCNNWLQEENYEKIVSISTSSTVGEYTWIPELTMGEHDHEKRQLTVNVITVVYEAKKQSND